jgi:hypothetical protein
MRRCVFGVVIAFLVAGSVTFGQGQGKAVQVRFTVSAGSVPIGSCGDFNVLMDASVDVHLTTLYDPDTNLPIFGRETDKWWWAVFRNSVTGTSLDGGPGENSQTLYHYDDAGNVVVTEGSGLQGKVMVPGYGWIFMDTGHVRLDSTWTVFFETGHDSYWNQELTALCEFLR